MTWFDACKSDSATCKNWPKYDECNLRPEFYDKSTCLKYCKRCKEDITKLGGVKAIWNSATSTAYDWSPMDATYWKNCRRFLR